MDVTVGLRRRKRVAERTPARVARQRALARLALIAMSLAFLTPLYWMVATALKDNQELTIFPPTLFPLDPHWGNFVEAVRAIPFGRYFFNSASITLFTVVGSVISNTIIAYGFSRIEWPGRDIVFYCVIATIFIPFPVIMVPLFIVFAKLGWIDTFLPLIVPMFFGHPLYIFMLRQYLRQLPMELSDAARIDGASEWQILRHVILPLAKPAIAVVAIFAAVYAWNDFLAPLIYLQDESKYTLSIGLQFYRSVRDVQFNLLMGASSLVMLPIVVVFLFFQRAFIEGVTMGSVK